MLISFGWMSMRNLSCVSEMEPFLWQNLFAKLGREDKIFCLRLTCKMDNDFVLKV